jgi:hypothetical protein
MEEDGSRVQHGNSANKAVFESTHGAGFRERLWCGCGSHNNFLLSGVMEGADGEDTRHWAQGSGPNGMRAGSPSGVPSAPGAGPSIRYGMPASSIILKAPQVHRLRTGPAVCRCLLGAGGRERGGWRRRGVTGAEEQRQKLQLVNSLFLLAKNKGL